MENALIAAAECLPAVLRGAGVSVALQGWPAAVSVIAVCLALVAIFAIVTFGPARSGLVPAL